MATIVKRGDKWRVQIRRRGQPTLSKTFSKKALAEKWARETEVELDQGRTDVADPDLGALIQRYLDEIEPLKNLQRSHKATMRSLKRKVAGTTVAGINPGWMLDLAKAEDVAPSTRLQLFQFLGMVLRTAHTLWGTDVDWDEWTRGMGALKRLGLTQRPQERDQRVPPDVVEAVLDAMRSSLPMDDLVHFSIASGLRLGELVRIRWADLDSGKRLITIRDRKHPVLKSGNHQTIPLLGEALPIIARQVRQADEIFPYTAGSVSAAWHRAVVRAGYSDIRWHDLRHEAICRLFEAGYEIQEVALVSGHRDWNMLRRYTHLRPESLHRD